ncbi:MAG: addiction module antitoxin RelB [Desulfobacteraceae bacterium 4572_187]|nr:MAG: addiction module antitoxin RelB [Desulfobacteraceae bacterium 4572_187]
MAYRLIYHADVKNTDLPKIDNKNKAMIKRAIKEHLAMQPEKYGSPLRRTLKGYWKLRVGDYRVIFKISGYDIFILGIMNRKSVYSQINKRVVVQ